MAVTTWNTGPAAARYRMSAKRSKRKATSPKPGKKLQAPSLKPELQAPSLKPKERQAASVECEPNRQAPSMAFRGDRT